MAGFAEREFLDPKVLAKLSRLPLFARRPMQGNVAGRHQSPHRGSSVEFAEYRKYVPGDDTRRLDWRAWGRSDRFYIKEFEADTNLRLCLVVDVSGSMKYGSETTTKFDYARRMAAALGYIALNQGDAVGLSLASTDISLEITPSRRTSHLAIINDALERARPGGETGLAAALHAVAEKIRQRALVVIISDFFVEPEELADAFQHLRFRKHDAAAFQLFDPEELEFGFEGPTRFVDLEGGPSFMADPASIRKTYMAALERYRKGLEKVMREAAVDYHRVRLDEPYDEVLARFLVARSHGKKGGR